MLAVLFLQAAYSGSCSLYDLLSSIAEARPFLPYIHCPVNSEVFPTGTALSSVSVLVKCHFSSQMVFFTCTY